MYCGRLAKNVKVGVATGNCVQYFILIYFPLSAGGGFCSISVNSVLFNFEVEIFCALFL
jgi:hypothetical protein